MGSGKGKALVLSENNISKSLSFEKPYVLIAKLTTPDITPLLIKAEAIVTDIGGLSSHAANIARELGIPCIVDTKHASTTINQGDYVEVNADKNIVSWI
ncbi:MAG: hypothetical protein OMM_07700 [Candidatus Magnetoglobus multicellularis str. Araruama]|uniref:PEP-utilising enzyme mobile domain-containing protein n=1 Tax=Candidatus Magnetoglobus multicellularis str. Araruama TaxID=890399 RepID=A0A1V1PBH2_9BACT|nr:MAG: hypothetical protein OMM_07700 [Candidatus Magnetoglobus multicellularis str. Araruama]